jgi:hypothetical protein
MIFFSNFFFSTQGRSVPLSEEQIEVTNIYILDIYIYIYVYILVYIYIYYSYLFSAALYTHTHTHTHTHAVVCLVLRVDRHY